MARSSKKSRAPRSRDVVLVGQRANARMAQRIEIWPIERLRPYERNARTHSASQVAKIAGSIARWGFNNPILVDSRDGIVAGHGRLAGAQSLGLKEVPVVVLDHLSENDRRAYLIIDNKLADEAGWDELILASELAALEADGIHPEEVGFSAADQDALSRSVQASTAVQHVDPPPPIVSPRQPARRPLDRG